ncbi:MAG: dipeptide ABC transporter ATP-binding protein [Desulfobacteraceae bacterium]|nr:MAG: dipeptide ABC transporter ATP-binding protein [Desulfobacteraceae bacterium]
MKEKTSSAELPFRSNAGSGTAELVRTEDVKKHYPLKKGLFASAEGHVKAVDGVSIRIAEREILGLVGESGCGKSTLGRVILRLEDATEGRVFFDGQDVSRLAKEELRRLRAKMQIIFQDPFSSLNPRYTVDQLVREPLIIHRQGDSASRKERVLTLLKEVGLNEEHLYRFPHQFSGGQRQRIGVARALALNPKFIVCDEPVSALDVSIQAQVMNLLQDLQRKLGLTYLFISHDLSVVRHLCNRIAVMYLGRIVEMSPTEILHDHARHPYTRALLSASPIANPNLKRKRIILKGDVPSPVDPPSGCHFHTRCPRSEARCRTQVPPPAEVSPGHWVRCFDCA